MSDVIPGLPGSDTGISCSGARMFEAGGWWAACTCQGQAAPYTRAPARASRAATTLCTSPAACAPRASQTARRATSTTRCATCTRRAAPSTTWRHARRSRGKYVLLSHGLLKRRSQTPSSSAHEAPYEARAWQHAELARVALCRPPPRAQRALRCRVAGALPAAADRKRPARRSWWWCSTRTWWPRPSSMCACWPS